MTLSIELNNLADLGGFLSIDRKKLKSSFDYFNNVSKITFLTARILEEFGRLSAYTKDIRAYCRIPTLGSFYLGVKSGLNLLNSLFDNAKHNDIESSAHNSFYFFATIVDLINDFQAITNAIGQLTAFTVEIASSIATLIYPLTLITILVATLIKLRDLIYIKSMIRSDIAVMCRTDCEEKELDERINKLLEKRLTGTREELAKIDRDESDLELREIKKADLQARKEAKFKRTVGNEALLELKKLSKDPQIDEKRKILAKINLSYNYETAAKIRHIAKNIIVFSAVIFLSQGLLIIPGCALLILVALMTISDLNRSKNFSKHLKSL